MSHEHEDDPLEVYWDDVRVARYRSSPVEPTDPLSAQPGDMVIGTSRNRILVTIKADGTLQYGPEYSPDEAATVFWEAMGQRRIAMEDRFLVIQHMEAVLTRLGRADMECERLRRQADSEPDELRKRELTQYAELSMNRLNMVAHQAIELGRALVRRPDMPTPAVPPTVPESIRLNPVSAYEGQEGLPPDDDR